MFKGEGLARFCAPQSHMDTVAILDLGGLWEDSTIVEDFKVLNKSCLILAS